MNCTVIVALRLEFDNVWLHKLCFAIMHVQGIDCSCNHILGYTFPRLPATPLISFSYTLHSILVCVAYGLIALFRR